MIVWSQAAVKKHNFRQVRKTWMAYHHYYE